MNLKNKLLLLVLPVFILSACNLQLMDSANANKANNDEALVLTVTANALLLENSGQPPVTEPPAQEQVVVIVTATPEGGAGAPSSTEQVNPAQVLPPATGDVTVTVTTATNCRTGPGQGYPSIYGLPIGVTGKVVGKNPSVSNYWVIEIPNSGGGTCWLWGQYATVTGDTSGLKVFAVPATPTPTATLTPTATSTTAAAVAPNAPAILTSSVVCSDAGGGNRNYAVQISWADNSTNETSFWVSTTPAGSFYGTSANATSTTFTEVLPAGTTLTASLTSQNGTGSSAPVSTTFVCP